MTWLSKRAAQLREEASAPSEGIVSIGGGEPAVVTDGELRQTELVLPGGYFWKPGASDTVLVLRGTRDCIAGQIKRAPADLQPGEVRIASGGASIVLRNDGKIELIGSVFVNGKELEV